MLVEYWKKVDMEDYFNNKYICDISVFTSKMKECYVQEWSDNIKEKPKLRLYKTFKTVHQPENYVSSNLSRSERSLLAQLRFGILPIHIETGRFSRKPVEERLCALCNLNEIEDEEHFLLSCTKYDNIRNVLFNKCLNKEPNFHTFDNSNKLNLLMTGMANQTAKFVKQAYHIRFNSINK